MSRYIDLDKVIHNLKKWSDISPTIQRRNEDFINILENEDIVPAIQLDKIKQAREQIIDEKDFAYADFERYKEEVLHVESDELPDDDFRFGMERCLEILGKLIESEEE